MAMVIPNGILNNPSLSYVRHWLLRHVQILAVVDMQRDLFQPANDTQTSIVLMRRLNAGEVAQAEAKGLDYPIFMAVAEKIGHDKRGNVIYRRTPEGEDALISRMETVTEIDQQTGAEVLRQVALTERQIDDELPEVADAYLHWLSVQHS
jgi:type I restriction enzyme M protein